MKAGEGFRFECDLQNQSPNELRYGIRASDEMCILGGWVWPAGKTELPPPNCSITWVDGEGIGHPADEAGGFPAASAQKARLCAAGIKLSGASSVVSADCTQCVCDSCADVLMSCAADTDCSALIDCFSQDCGGLSDCIKACKAALHDHSSAIGMLQQVQACLGSRCPGCAPSGP
jgi:hypothetical protein